MRSRYHFALAVFTVLFACQSAPDPIPSWSGDETQHETIGSHKPFLILPGEVIEVRSKLSALPDQQVPRKWLGDRFFDEQKSCLLIRLGPGSLLYRKLSITFSRQPDFDRRESFFLTATIANPASPEENNQMLLEYDYRGRLTSTVTLPRTSSASERAGTREEFFSFVYLPESNQWIAEGQRLVGETPDASFEMLPASLLIDKNDPYRKNYRASAYLVCDTTSRAGR